MTAEPPWLTIITVVKDDPAGLKRSLASVSRQQCRGVELVIVDGSRGGETTCEVVAGAALPDALSVVYTHQSPQGIYPAMNHGLEYAGGEYVLYLNAGDCLASDDVLQKLQRLVTDSRPAWLVGRIRIHAPDQPPVVSESWDFAAEKQHLFSRGKFPPHQGTVAQRSLLQQAGGFDASYTIAADYALALRLSTITDPLMTELVVADFHEGGVSTQRWKDSFRQFHRARREILDPAGLTSVDERWQTLVHFLRVWLYRDVVTRARRGTS